MYMCVDGVFEKKKEKKGQNTFLKRRKKEEKKKKKNHFLPFPIAFNSFIRSISADA